MFSSRRKPALKTSNSFSSSISSSANSYIPKSRRPSPVVLRQLTVHNLDETNSRNRNHSPSSRQKDRYRIPRPNITLPNPSLHESIDNSIWTPSGRRAYIQESSSSTNSTARTSRSERPLYQITLPPNILPPPIQYQIVPIHSQRPSSTHSRHRIKRKKKYLQEKNPGLYTTLCSGGCSTFVALLYLSFCLALPLTKFALGISYMHDCPADNKIPLYMIVSGACGFGIIFFVFLSSACKYYRSYMIAKKSTHTFMICFTAFARGMQGVIAIFLFIWFFLGNVWVFSVRYRVQTNNPNYNNYCHPVLYWFSFYVLIFTYVYAIFLCSMKFLTNFFCCRSFDIWKRAFT
ncbi:unnamed protein product [Rotaria magnacalcarata]|uniref:Uncharacterized protein n=2 Tax=Rotaria magnacalcarata TaxID=392030 RepID=A0A816QUQ7_9BILA|nr:unnamed protein product [Rotaria magnacalcarata]CAF2066489.1 unnamed protein product [Rotaria magnacalcarata]